MNLGLGAVILDGGNVAARTVAFVPPEFVLGKVMVQGDHLPITRDLGKYRGSGYAQTKAVAAND